MLTKIPQVAKAIAAGVLAFGASFSVALQDNDVNTAEWINIAIATVVAAIGVWAVRNAPAKDEPPLVD